MSFLTMAPRAFPELHCFADDFRPEDYTDDYRVELQQLIDASQAPVNGTVRLKLYKGNVIVVSRDSKTDSLFDMNIATFDEDGGAYNQADAALPPSGDGFGRLDRRQGFFAVGRVELIDRHQRHPQADA